jgi:hypothetical protein
MNGTYKRPRNVNFSTKNQTPIGKEEEKRLLAQRQKEEGTLGGFR